MNPDTVFVWNKVGELPVSAAYGVSVSCSDGIICIGGTDGQDALTSVYKIRWDEKSEKNGSLMPALPIRIRWPFWKPEIINAVSGGAFT